VSFCVLLCHCSMHQNFKVTPAAHPFFVSCLIVAGIILRRHLHRCRRLCRFRMPTRQRRSFLLATTWRSMNLRYHDESLGHVTSRRACCAESPSCRKPNLERWKFVAARGGEWLAGTRTHTYTHSLPCGNIEQKCRVLQRYYFWHCMA